jgi:hypothetical protein
MNVELPERWPLLAGTAVAIGVALAAGPNLAIAVPAAGVAVLAAAIYLADAVRDRARAPARAAFAPVASDPDRVATAFRSGRFGRREIVKILDRLERDAPRSTSPVRAAPEIDALADLPPEEFERYVRARVEALEAES